MIRKHVVPDMGPQPYWWCPVCGALLVKAHWLTDSGRYHREDCHKPLEPVLVTTTRVSTSVHSASMERQRT